MPSCISSIIITLRTVIIKIVKYILSLYLTCETCFPGGEIESSLLPKGHNNSFSGSNDGMYYGSFLEHFWRC